MPEPTITVSEGRTVDRTPDHYIALKQLQYGSESAFSSNEVPPMEKPTSPPTPAVTNGATDTPMEEEQKNQPGPILAKANSEPGPTSSNSAALMPPPPPPTASAFAWNAQNRPSTMIRPPLPPTHHQHHHHHHHHHLHAPRPSHPNAAGFDGNSGSRMRGDGFLLDADDEPETNNLDFSTSSESDSLNASSTSLTHGNSGGMDTTDPDRIFSMGMFNEPNHLLAVPMNERPRSAGPAYQSVAQQSVTVPTPNENHAAGPMNLICPSCNEQPAGAEVESSFHAHITKCFITRLTNSPGRALSKTPQHMYSNQSPNTSADSQGLHGPIRKTRTRASSAAAATGTAAELASALAMQDGSTSNEGSRLSSPNPDSIGSAHTSPKDHGYHPYSSGNLTQTLRALRQKVDQLDLHQRISLMEAFNRLSRQAMQEHTQNAAAMTPRSKQKLRSAANSPAHTPARLKHPGQEDKACSNILSLLYSPRITAPHPSPSTGMSQLHIGAGGNAGFPSPLVIGVSGHPSFQNNDSSIERPLGSPMVGMDTLELGAPTKSYIFTTASPEPVSSPLDESELSSSMIMDNDGDSISNGMNSSFALTAGSFGTGLSSGPSSPSSVNESTPSSVPSEQTSPSAADPSEQVVREETVRIERYPTHCNPAMNETSDVVERASANDSNMVQA